MSRFLFFFKFTSKVCRCCVISSTGSKFICCIHQTDTRADGADPFHGGPGAIGPRPVCPAQMTPAHFTNSISSTSPTSLTEGPSRGCGAVHGGHSHPAETFYSPFKVALPLRAPRWNGRFFSFPSDETCDDLPPPHRSYRPYGSFSAQNSPCNIKLPLR